MKVSSTQAFAEIGLRLEGQEPDIFKLTLFDLLLQPRQAGPIANEQDQGFGKCRRQTRHRIEDLFERMLEAKISRIHDDKAALEPVFDAKPIFLGWDWSH